MVVTYEIATQNMDHARTVAMRRALAEGWSRATIMSLQKTGYNTYEVTMTVFK